MQALRVRIGLLAWTGFISAMPGTMQVMPHTSLRLFIPDCRITVLQLIQTRDPLSAARLKCKSLASDAFFPFFSSNSSFFEFSEF